MKLAFICLIVILLVLILVYAFAFNRDTLENEAANEQSANTAIANLADDEQWVLIDIGEEGRVLLVSNSTYEDGDGNNASTFCDVYYDTDDKMYSLGRIESQSTAYPVR